MLVLTLKWWREPTSKLKPLASLLCLAIIELLIIIIFNNWSVIHPFIYHYLAIIFCYSGSIMKTLTTATADSNTYSSTENSSNITADNSYDNSRSR
jgi:glucose uptake protein GlcU